MTHVRFDKEMTGILKGVAILFMMLLHCYPNNYDVAIDFTYDLHGYQRVFRICVGIFVFLIGYGYSFSKTKDFRYSVQHIKKLLIPYWIILFIFTFPVCYKAVLNEDKLILLYNLVGIDSHYNWYSWFVYFFIFTMIEMPFLSRYIDKKPVSNSIIVVIGVTLLSILWHEVPRIMSMLFGIQVPPIAESKPMLALFYCLSFTPGVILGYLFAHNSYFERINIERWPRLGTVLSCVLIIITTLVLHYVTENAHNPFQLDFFYAPLMIGAIVVLFSKFELKHCRKVLVKLGELSVYMWFFHALFYTKVVRWFYQPAITIFKDINLVVLWTILITFISSWLLKTIVDRITLALTKSNGR